MASHNETKLGTRMSGRRRVLTSGLPNVSRWTGLTERRTRQRGRGNTAKEDLRKFKNMTIETLKFDEFDEWIDGDKTMRYSPLNADARKHLSGWAMRNTNNHNKKVLKKSCIGVFLCSRSCRTNTGEITSVRPATSDPARQKQTGKACPRPNCDGKLFHIPCTGKGGYPATHFWRVTDQVVLFQCKGIHDHPRPDVVKTTTAAKQALLEYHRRHRHERPKEICKKVGVFIHKSFSRVDRVARQLREVASEQQHANELEHPVSDIRKTSQEIPPSFALRSSFPVDVAWASPQKASDAVGKHAAVPSTSASYYHDYQTTHQPDMYASLPPHATYYGNYNGNNSHSAYNPYATTISSDYDQSNPSTNYDLGTQSSTSSAMSSYHNIKQDNSYGYQMPMKQSPRQASIPACSPNQSLSEVQGSVTFSHDYPNDQNSSIPVDYHTDTRSPVNTVEVSPVRSTYKRKGAPDLIPIEHVEPKHPKCLKENNSVELNPIKLGGHTPGINLDLSNFADIFDFSGLTQDEGLGLAGRPKSATLVTNDSAGNTSTQIAHTTTKMEVLEEETSSEQGEHQESGDEESVGKDDEQYSPVSTTPTTANEPTPYPLCIRKDTPDGSPSNTPVPQSKLHLYVPHSTTSNPSLTALDTHHSPGGSAAAHTSYSYHGVPQYAAAAAAAHSITGGGSTGTEQGDEENEGYINFLVRMYLGKDERQMSSLKSEFTVYNSDLQKAYSNRNHGDPGSYKSHNGQYEFSWYSSDHTRNAVHHIPRNVQSRLESYPQIQHADYSMGTRHDRSGY